VEERLVHKPDALEQEKRVSEEKKDVSRALALSLKERMLTTPFEKITIKQITDGAGVIRVTFYNHFQDKYDLLGHIVESEILEPVVILLKNNMYKEALTLIFTNIKKDSEFYMRAVKIEGQNSFEQITEECIYKLLLDLFSERSSGRPHPTHSWVTVDSLARYYSKSMTFVVMYWIRTGMEASPEEVAGVYEYIVTRSLWDVLEEL
jgi:probable dihydroxyacetone kinase regulator